MTHPTRKYVAVKLLYAALLSIFIGISINFLMVGSISRSLTSHLWSAGYSVSLGVPLFLNGYLFRWFEKRYVNWIKYPVKSVFAALSMHLVYSSFVIFTVNWFWFIVILNRNWENF